MLYQSCFMKRGYEYYSVPTLLRLRPHNLISLHESLFHKIYMCQTDVMKRLFDKDLIENVLKLTAEDLKMGQRDRHSNNVLLKKVDDKIELAPIFDYGFSYITSTQIGSDIYYDNPFLIVRKNKLSIKSLVRKYPNLFKYIEKFRDINIEDVLLEIEKEKNIILEKTEIEDIVNIDKENNKLLKKI